jgi:hypothetical protein
MAKYIRVWQCVDCGRIETHPGCTRKCRDEKVALVSAEDYEQLRDELEAARTEVAALATYMRQVVGAKPRNDEWERCFRGAQAHLRRGLSAIGR